MQEVFEGIYTGLQQIIAPLSLHPGTQTVGTPATANCKANENLSYSSFSL